jgi:Pyruvate/2-oxoacid:ferredoxin oxidoreductase gamma subunit/ferredoxin
MVKSVFEELNADKPKKRFTVGIIDDVTHLSSKWDPDFHTEKADINCSMFYGLGSDGTVGANKNTVKIIGENANLFAQGYFVYDSKKAGAMTVSHLRFSPRPINSTYLIDRAQFVACHQPVFLDRMDVLEKAEQGATFLLNTPYGPDEIWDHLPLELQQSIIDKQLKFYVIDALTVAEKPDGRTHQHGHADLLLRLVQCAASGRSDRSHQAGDLQDLRQAGRGRCATATMRPSTCVDRQPARVKVPAQATSKLRRLPPVTGSITEFVERVTSTIAAGKGDLLPVSAMPIDGTFPTATAQYEKRSIAVEIPIWDADICIQCGLCALVCPTRRSAPKRIRMPRWPEHRQDSCRGSSPARIFRNIRSRSKSRRTTAPAAVCALTSALPRARKRSSTRRSTWSTSWSIWNANGRTTSSSCRFPNSTGRSQRQHRQGLAVAAAVVRVLGRVCRLRRDALCQADVAVVRRPHRGGQRDGLLVDLRRQPADDAVHGQFRKPRPRLVQLAVRGQRRVRPGLPSGPGHAQITLRKPCSRRWPARSATIWWASC